MRKLCRVLMALPLISLSMNVCLAQNTQAPVEHQIQKPEDFRKITESRFADDYFLLLTFDQLPDKAMHVSLAEKQIELLEYRSKNTYLASIPADLDPSELRALKITSVAQPAATEKTSDRLLRKDYPEWAREENGKVDVAILFHDGATTTDIQNFLNDQQAVILEGKHRGNKTVIARVPENRILNITNSPLVSFLDVEQEPAGKLNHEVCINQKVNTLNSSLPGGYNLRGNGVTVGVGDGGELGNHIDFDNRVINEANGTYNSFGDHGDHVSGIIGGAGHLNPRHPGMAPECTIVTQKTSQITYNTENYFNLYEMVLTNNSYGTSFNCNTNGSYNYSAQTLDWQLREYPEVLHIFAAGNSGGGTCEPYPQGYRSVLRYYQSAKNVLTVGMAEETRVIANSSSRGPVKDGRLKPEIIGVGRNVVSTGRDYNYSTKGGTSMAAPAVTGTLALLVEKYRLENDGENPEGALLKAIACNTADDLGNPGPDYIHGFGLINGRRAAEVIAQNQFYGDEISEGETKVQAINIPAGVKQAKIMLYWHDKEAAVYPDKALVNNLDISILTPTGEEILPWVLDPSPSGVANNATRGKDTLNNIEQVTIDLPVAGSYTILVKGDAVPFGPQSFFTTYELIRNDIVLTHPFGGESFAPGTTEFISWDTDPINTHTFKIEYSIDGGNSWMLVADEVESHKRTFKWTVPDDYSPEAKVRISKNGTSINAVNETLFTIMGTPEELNAIPTCEKKIILDWKTCDYSMYYEVKMFDGEEMRTIGTTEDTIFIVEENLELGVDYWFSVQAMGAGNSSSQRIIAIAAIPEDIEICPWDDNPVFEPADIALIGRDQTLNSLGDDETISIAIKNIGLNDLETFEMYYSVDGGAPVHETFNGFIPSGETQYIDFNTKADLTGVGMHYVDAWVEIPGNNAQYSDSLIGIAYAEQISNAPVLLPYSEYFTGVESAAYDDNRIGLLGAEKWDFEGEGVGELEIIQGQSMILRPMVPANGMQLNNSAVLTLNMSHYSEMEEQVKLSFDYKFDLDIAMPADENHPNGVYVRGKDTDEWIQLKALTEKAQDWRSIRSADITALLVENGQMYTASFQLKFVNDNNIPVAFRNVVVDKHIPLETDPNYEDFTVVQIGGDILLEWTPVNPEDIYFEIEVLNLGDDNDDFEVIGTVNAERTTTEPYFYSFLDSEPGERGWRHYRIKAIKQDGSFVFSPVLSVLLNNQEVKGVFPNPFVDQLNVAYSSNNQEEVEVIITDQKGVLIYRDAIQLSPGEHIIPVQLDEHLPGGMYLLKIIAGKKTTCHKVVK